VQTRPAPQAVPSPSVVQSLVDVAGRQLRQALVASTAAGITNAPEM